MRERGKVWFVTIYITSIILLTLFILGYASKYGFEKSNAKTEGIITPILIPPFLFPK